MKKNWVKSLVQEDLTGSSIYARPEKPASECEGLSAWEEAFVKIYKKAHKTN